MPLCWVNRVRTFLSMCISFVAMATVYAWGKGWLKIGSCSQLERAVSKRVVTPGQQGGRCSAQPPLGHLLQREAVTIPPPWEKLLVAAQAKSTSVPHRHEIFPALLIVVGCPSSNSFSTTCREKERAWDVENSSFGSWAVTCFGLC